MHRPKHRIYLTGGPVLHPDHTLERVVVRKIALRFLPLLGLGFVVLNIDRSNIGVAALTMNEELGITAAQFGLAAGIYFWGYSLLELPSNLICAKVGARLWLSRIMLTWGVLTIVCGVFIDGHTSLYVMRILVGVAEAGWSPGAILFIAMWFPKSVRARMYSGVIACMAAATFFTPAMTALLNMHGLAGLSGWQWVFIITGLPAIVLSGCIFLLLRDSPENAAWLDPEQRRWLQQTLEAERGEQAGTGKSSVARALRDPKVWALCATYFLICFSFNGYNMWLPLILKSLNLSNQTVGWFAALPALIAIVPMLLWLRHSDRTGERTFHFVIPVLLTSAGFVIAAVFFHHPAVAVIGFCIAAVGLYSAISSYWFFPSSYLSGTAAAAGIGLIHTIANTSGYFGPQVLGILKQSTGDFRTGLSVLAVTAMMAGASLYVLVTKTSVGLNISIDAPMQDADQSSTGREPLHQSAAVPGGADQKGLQ